LLCLIFRSGFWLAIPCVLERCRNREKTQHTDPRRTTRRRFTPSRRASADSRRADVGERPAAKLRRSGMPRRAMTISRSPSALLRTNGACWSGKIPGNAGRWPVLSLAVRNRARMAACPLISEFRLEMWGIVGLLRRVQCLLGIKQGVRSCGRRLWPTLAMARLRNWVVLLRVADHC
jgi:hypothetical protein